MKLIEKKKNIICTKTLQIQSDKYAKKYAKIINISCDLKIQFVKLSLTTNKNNKNEQIIIQIKKIKFVYV